MNENDFKKGIKDIKNIKLTSGEKKDILNNILNLPEVSPYAPKKSFWNVFLYQNKTSYVFALLFILVSTGSTLAYNAEKSLPGQKLYFLKVNVTEPIRDLTNLSPEKRAEWESVKTVRRLEEALDLTVQGKLDEQNRNDLEKRFNKHIDAFDANIKIASSTKKSDLIEVEFEADISAKAKVFEDLEEKLKDIEEQKKEEYKKIKESEDKKEKEYESEDEDEKEFKKLKSAVLEKIEDRKSSKKESEKSGRTKERENEE